MPTKSKIFVDGNCVICDWEVSHYKRMAPDAFDLVDISDSVFDASVFGLTAQAVNKHMHVMTPEGRLVIGVDAFAHIWSRVEKLKWAVRWIENPVINIFAKAGYSIFCVVRPYLPKKQR